MIGTTVIINSAGKAVAAAGGRGFLVMPGGNLPGTYPFTVVPFGPTGQPPLPVPGPQAFYLSPGKEFTALTIEGAAPGRTYIVYAFSDDSEFIDVGSSRCKRSFQIYTTGSLASAAPVTGNDHGFDVPNNISALTFYFGGDAQIISVWVRSISGVWYLSETIDLADGMVVTRDVITRDGRLAFSSPADTTSLEVDATWEV